MTRDRITGIVLALVTVVIVMITQRDVGIARDETVYFNAGSKYADWWIGLVTFDHGAGEKAITKSWGGKNPTDNNREHPPLMKTLFGFSEKLLHDKLGIADEVSAYRFPSAVMHGLLVWLVYMFVLGLWGFTEAIVAALFVLFLPRALFHASLACFDAPIMTLWFATVYAYWRGLASKGWPWYAGVVFGLALATKHNALLLPLALGVHYLVLGYRTDRLRGLLAHRWRMIVSLAVLGPLTLFVLWPWLWHAPFENLGGWLSFHLKHVHYNFEYLGDNWNAPRFPWHVALVTTLFTVPVVTLVSALTGAGVWIARALKKLPEPAPDARMPVLLLVMSAVASAGPFFLGTTPIFGAEKHWMPALPTICIAAAVGVVWAARTALAILSAKRTFALRAQYAIVGVFAGVVLLAAAAETRAAHPYALTWYNALAGGAPGGADHGMNRQFWGVAARGVLPELARLEPAGGFVYTHDAAPAWGYYHREGLLPKNLKDAGWEQMGIDRSKLAIVIHEKHFNRHDFLIWQSYKTVQPVFVLRSDGVPIVSVYRRQ
jgi:hypothetical protein